MNRCRSVSFILVLFALILFGLAGQAEAKKKPKPNPPAATQEPSGTVDRILAEPEGSRLVRDLNRDSATGNKADNVLNGLVGTQVGETYGVGGLGLVPSGSSTNQPHTCLRGKPRVSATLCPEDCNLALKNPGEACHAILHRIEITRQDLLIEVIDDATKDIIHPQTPLEQVRYALAKAEEAARQLDRMRKEDEMKAIRARQNAAERRQAKQRIEELRGEHSLPSAPAK
jgi:hypothetical protein